ncbi:MAG: hypothetical protein CL838_04930, partial [Crocinitomicaceae bacterium]|nr:hypothetical protein [Crocinitomicaceae bacterium]
RFGISPTQHPNPFPSQVRSSLLTGHNNASGSGTDWGIYTTGEDKNYFFGKTGIGESSPEYKLDVQIGDNDGISARFEGNIQIDQTGNANRAYGFVSTNNGSTMIGGNLRFNDLETGGTHDGYSKGTNDRGSAGLIMDNSNANSGVFRFINATDTDTDSYSISELMRITSAGNVGIGTDSPSTMLEVRNSTGLAKIKIRGDDGATSTRAELHIDRTSDARGGGIRIESSTGTLSQWFIGSPYNGGSSSNGFSIGSNSSQPEYRANSHFYIDNNGNIGINNSGTTISEKFEVYDGNIFINRQSGSDNFVGMSKMYIKESDTKSYVNFDDFDYLEYDRSENDLYFKINNSAKLTILDNGYVGIGNTDPNSLLTLGDNGGTSGKIRFEASDGDSGYMTINTDDELFIGGMNTLHSSSTKSGFDNQTSSVQSDYDKTFFRTEVNAGEISSYGLNEAFSDQHITIYLDHTNDGVGNQVIRPGFQVQDANLSGNWYLRFISGTKGQSFNPGGNNDYRTLNISSTTTTYYTVTDVTMGDDDEEFHIEDDSYADRSFWFSPKDNEGPIYRVNYFIPDDIEVSGLKWIMTVEAWYPE